MNERTPKNGDPAHETSAEKNGNDKAMRITKAGGVIPQMLSGGAIRRKERLKPAKEAPQ